MFQFMRGGQQQPDASERAMQAAVNNTDWRQVTPLPETEKLQAASTLMVFDFDCTVAEYHMFSELRTEAGQSALHTNASRFYDAMFGVYAHHNNGPTDPQHAATACAQKAIRRCRRTRY
jgi:hypothetical protein